MIWLCTLVIVLVDSVHTCEDVLFLSCFQAILPSAAGLKGRFTQELDLATSDVPLERLHRTPGTLQPIGSHTITVGASRSGLEPLQVRQVTRHPLVRISVDSAHVTKGNQCEV